MKTIFIYDPVSTSFRSDCGQIHSSLLPAPWLYPLPFSKYLMADPSISSWRNPVHYNLRQSSSFHSINIPIPYQLFLDILHNSSILVHVVLISSFFNLFTLDLSADRPWKSISVFKSVLYIFLLTCHISHPWIIIVPFSRNNFVVFSVTVRLHS